MFHLAHLCHSFPVSSLFLPLCISLFPSSHIVSNTCHFSSFSFLVSITSPLPSFSPPVCLHSLSIPFSLSFPHSCLLLHILRLNNPFSLSFVQSTASSAEDEKSQLSMRPQTPQAGGEEGEGSEVDGQVIWNKATHLPTPEEKMRQAAKAVPTDIVAINVTGKGHLLTTSLI